MVDAELGPIEENIKVLLVDVVRRCQSTVAQNYSRIISSSNVGLEQATTNPRLLAGAEDQPHVPIPETNSPISTFEEPLFRNTLSTDPTWMPSLVGDFPARGAFPSHQSSPGIHADSGCGFWDEYPGSDATSGFRSWVDEDEPGAVTVPIDFNNFLP